MKGGSRGMKRFTQYPTQGYLGKKSNWGRDFYYSSNQLTEKQIKEAFTRSGEGNGTINTNNIGSAMLFLGLNLIEEVQHMINEEEDGGNDTIDYRKFLTMVEKTIDPTEPNESSYSGRYKRLAALRQRELDAKREAQKVVAEAEAQKVVAEAEAQKEEEAEAQKEAEKNNYVNAEDSSF